MTAFLASLNPWAVLILGFLAATVLAFIPLSLLLDKLRDARREASAFRVCRCHIKAHHDGPAWSGRMPRYGDALPM